MYKVVLADDEPMALEVLKYIVDWEGMGFHICESCSNGKEAIEAIDRHNPEVVITDIRMPVVDGLDLIKYERENGRDDINFVLVSGYGEFEYARKAMQYDVRYYLQKPILQEDIDEVIIEIKRQLDKQAVNKLTMEDDKKAAINGILEELILGSDEKKAFECLKRMQGEMERINWNCILVDFEGNKFELGDECKAIRRKAKKAAEGFPNLFILEQSVNRLIILQGVSSDEAIRSRMFTISKSIYERLTTLASCNFVIAIGEEVKGISQVKHCYYTACRALRERFYTGFKSIIRYEEIKDKPFNFEFNEIFMSNKVFEAVEEANVEKLKSIIDNTFNYFKKYKIAPDIVVMFVSNIIFKAKNLISDSESKIIDDSKAIRGLKESKSTISELNNFFETFCIGCCEHFNAIRNKKAKGNLDKIESFIRANYKRNITIRELAENVYMHPAYLGQLFTQRFGMGFNEYIHLLRIEEAKKLLNETQLKSCEVAEKLGYSNYNSFLQQFQKYTGMKPKEFRDDIQ
ncbi:response regulator [Clostridium oryzae]|uniref:Stage 0 sporulation protein A homolog n=1 Tax=Clostridium oryzae TaxID=1450648 RepID=A0A1V4IMW2_9CLOT|nr:response regulator [Clostridium oryzae]OPJ61388.1 putative response regulatory protein [Clostridium oryzae]